jgi:hypothetical protein
MKKLIIITSLLLSTVFIAYALILQKDPEKTHLKQEAKDYWLNGEGELNSYELTQARYGEYHKGEAVLVFVAEDFSSTKQVKPDQPGAGDDVTKVLKMNMTKKFITGIYPYSMMLSVFMPFNAEQINKSMKVVCSVQEWCGQSFMQMNRNDAGYALKRFSYFESEGDTDTSFKSVLLEDEIWTMIRIDPSMIPEGHVKILPGLFSFRLRHTPVRIEEAKITHKEIENASVPTWISKKNIQGSLVQFQLDYTSDKRSMTIYYESDYPHKIIAWEETYKDGFEKNPKELTTRAVLRATIRLDYWNHHLPADSVYRDSLILDSL